MTENYVIFRQITRHRVNVDSHSRDIGLTRGKTYMLRGITHQIPRHRVNADSHSRDIGLTRGKTYMLRGITRQIETIRGHHDNKITRHRVNT